MSRLRRVVEPSKLMPGATGLGRSRAADLPTAGEEVADAFQRMVESRVAEEGVGGRHTQQDPPEIEQDAEVAAPVSVEDADEIEAVQPQAVEPLVDFEPGGNEAGEAGAVEPLVDFGPDEEPPVKTDDDLDASDPVPGTPVVLDPTWRIADAATPRTATPETAPAAGTTPAARSEASGWTRLEPGALAEQLGKVPRKPTRAPVQAARPAEPLADVAVEPRTGASQGIRGLLAALGESAANATTPGDSNLTTAPPPVAASAASSWAEVLKQREAQRSQTPAKAGDAATGGVESAPSANAGTGGAAPDMGGAAARIAEPAPPPPTALPQGDGARAGARPGTPDGMVATPDDQPPGAMRLRVPTRGGEMVRGNLQVDPDSRAVRLTLAPQDGDTARSMANAREMLRNSLAEEGYQLQNYTVRHEGRSLFRQGHEPQSQTQADTDAGGRQAEARDDNETEPRRRSSRREPTEDDPVVNGWFV